MSKKRVIKAKRERQAYTDEFKKEAVQMLMEGLSAASVSKRLGLSSPNLIYRWKSEQVRQSGAVAATLEAQVRELKSELQRAERERDILKKALAILGRHD